MKTKKVKNDLLYMPSREDIENVQVGDLAIDCFGRFSKVVEITCRKNDICGKLFVHYYTEFGPNNGRISMSMKEDEIVRHANINLLSHEIDTAEKAMIAEKIPAPHELSVRFSENRASIEGKEGEP